MQITVCAVNDTFRADQHLQWANILLLIFLFHLMVSIAKDNKIKDLKPVYSETKKTQFHSSFGNDQKNKI